MATPFELREELVTLLRRDLLGPADGEEEELSSYERQVTRRYIVGRLAPGGSDAGSAILTSALDDRSLGEAEESSVAVESDEGTERGPLEQEPVLVDSLLPSSAGFSCIVDGKEREVLVRASWARYERIESRVQKDAKGTPFEVWKRVPVQPEPLRISLEQNESSAVLTNEERVEVRWRCRRLENLWYLTLFLINGQSKKKRYDDSAWIFQVALSIESFDGEERPIFVQRKPTRSDRRIRLDPEERREKESLDLRYGHCQVFGKGHGCAMKAYRHEDDPPGFARKLALDFLPITTLPGQTSRTEDDDPLLQGIVLDMATLSKMNCEDLTHNLTRMADAYATWVESLPQKVPDSSFARVAKRAQDEAKRTLARMREGIAVLRNDANAFLAFSFTNKAMHYQRVHSIAAKRAQGTTTYAERKEILAKANIPENRSWRLFQLAFVLCNIATLANPLHRERSGEGAEAIAQLLWFATGGGKTEAYLGLTAFTLAMRRLAPDLGGLDARHGVGVFMRYTLRLLTLQQFQRAAALICACEVIRRAQSDIWGKEPFRLGLWVGSKSTPNTLEQADRQLKQFHGGVLADLSSPAQFRFCPWCGAPITENNIKVRMGVTKSDRCITFCSDTEGMCAFSQKQAPDEGLPVMVVDEEIYRRPPSLLISTVDKFAQMPWKGEVEMLFGRVAGLCPRHGFTAPEISDEHVGKQHRKYGSMPVALIEAHARLRPPDLIIQDELHLISGPLGSMTALYENAVDKLCEWTLNEKTVRPKVIASTATIRRASEQIRRLFNRNVEVFPPSGVDSRDDFFSLERKIGEHCPGRVYIGICTTGNRMPPTTVRVYNTVMAAAQLLFENNGAAADPWMTTIGYFKTIRELAGMRRLVEDEVRRRLEDKNQRGLAHRRLWKIEELTSRQGSHNIPNILANLTLPFVPGENDATNLPQRPYDVVLATNMISVGVDIERLGLMIIFGQPNTTSEYIQASSRVGRSSRAPGLILTIYNWARPRDLSHFEDFYGYHEAFQQQVEALSVTPFASRALDRGLAGVMVSLVRLLELEMNRNKDAKKLQEHEDILHNACASIIKRAAAITQDENDVDHIRRMLDGLREEWQQRIQQCTTVGLAYKKTGDSVGLLSTQDKPNELFSCPNSLRDVEKSVNLLLDMNNNGLSTREL